MSGLFHDPLMFVPLSVFVAGIVGSPHCVSMCGPIVINFAHRRSELFCYQFGRLIAYSLAGAFVGEFGELVLGKDRPQWLSNLSLLFIAGLLFINAYRAIAGKAFHLKAPTFLRQSNEFFWNKLRLLRPSPKLAAGGAGILTVFLPCGHLYGFLIGAVATGRASLGAAYMFAFWLGSAPLMSFGASWIQNLLRPRIRHGQRWAGVLLLAGGLCSVLAFQFKSADYFRQANVKNARSTAVVDQLICH